jgi:predicted dehydrogenase
MVTPASPSLNRRRFLRRSLAAAAAAPLLTYAGRAWAQSPNGRLNVAVIGVANQGRYNLDNVTHENVVALCDVDETFLNAAAKDLPRATKYADYRRLLERNDLDAVVVATPDHTHAVIGAAVLRSGRHLYCEKPLARTVGEARLLTKLAREQKRVTQMGTQIHAGENYRRVVELVRAGALGEVGEVHVWVGGGFGGKTRPKETPPVPATLNYDLWLGPVEPVPYSPEYLPFNWRHWWHFAGGTLADLGCHHVDLPHWALDLAAPDAVRVVDGPPPNADCAPTFLTAELTYPARGARPPVKLRWYHGDRRPTLFVGTKGLLLADYDRHVLLPEAQFADYARPARTIPVSPGHHREWTEACKTGGPTTCNFAYAGPLTEAVLLGNVAHRAGQDLTWDAAAGRAPNCPAADEFLTARYRAGWTL